MIVGIGLDLVAHARVARLLERFGERPLARLLTSRERKGLHGPAATFLAARLAAKEAAFKALGTGWAQGVTWKRAEILNRASGAPELHLSGAARAHMEAIGGRRVHVSLTHTREHAAAVVIIES